MSLAELTSSALPRTTGVQLQRVFAQQRLRMAKAIRRRIQRSIRMIAQWQRSQYYLATATRDIRAAAAHNEDIFLGSAFIALTVLIAVASTASCIFLQSFLAMSYLNDITGFSVLPLLIMFGGVLATLTGWVLAFTCNVLSLSVMDGATRRRNKSLRSTFRRSLRLASRVATSWLLVTTVLFAPIFVIGIMALLLVHTVSAGGATPYLEAGTLVVAAAVLWAIYAVTSFSLAPQVALFQPQMPLLETLRTSRQLLLRRGRPFILALSLSICVFLAAAYGLTTVLTQAIGSVADIVLYTSVLLAVIASNLVLTALYRKRRLARAR